MKEEIKKADGEICDYIVTQCPYCEKSVEEYWGRINDLTILYFDSGEIIECPHCKKEFIVNIEE